MALAPVRRLARRGQVRDAQRLVALMEKTAGSATADSSVGRNVGLDRAYIVSREPRSSWPVDALHARPTARADPGRSKRGDDRIPGAAYASAGRLPAPSASMKSDAQTTATRHQMQQIWLQSHASLGALYERAAHLDDARRVYSALVAQWKDGDSDIVLLKTVRERLSKLSS